MTNGHDTSAAVTESSRKPPALLAAGGLIGAVAASSCCILPLALFTVGAGGAWIGTLGSLSPYQPIFVAITVGFLAAGFYLVYRKPRFGYARNSTCSRPLSGRITRIALWSATVLVVAATAFPYLAPILVGA